MININGKRYNTWNTHLQEIFNEKIGKISLDGSFTCPNIDGKVAFGGCIYCSKEGSGEFSGGLKGDPLYEKYEKQKEITYKKWPKINKYIAYFQAFTNTYAPLEILKEKYEEALTFENIVGMSIGTRPDCIPDDVLDYLEELNKRTYLWVELGLQTSNDVTGKLINRGHNFQVFKDAVNRLKKRGIRVCAHIINGLPNETREDMMQTVKELNKLGIDGVKIHLLHVLNDTPLYNYYKQGKLRLLEEEEYVEIVVDQLEILSKNIVVQRLTGDAPRNKLVGPMWSTNKKVILNRIDKMLKERNSCQGSQVEKVLE